MLAEESTTTQRLRVAILLDGWKKIENHGGRRKTKNHDVERSGGRPAAAPAARVARGRSRKRKVTDKDRLNKKRKVKSEKRSTLRTTYHTTFKDVCTIVLRNFDQKQ